MKQLFESIIINGEWHENKELQGRAKKVEMNDKVNYKKVL